MVHTWPAMTSYYTIDTFLRVFLSLSLLVLLVPSLLLWNGGRKRLISGVPILLLLLQALSVVTPWPPLREVLHYGMLFLIPPSIFWFFVFLRDPGRTGFEQYHSWIIDSLRESVLVFDTDLNFHGSNDSAASPDKIETMRDILLADHTDSSSGEGTVRVKDSIIRYRFRKIHEGYLFLIADFTEEQALLDELKEKNRILRWRQIQLHSAEELDIPSKRELTLRAGISKQILIMVREKLKQLRLLITSGEPSDRILIGAEETLSDIRMAVRHIADKGKVS